MCMSVLHQVVGASRPDTVETEDLDGGRHTVSLLALGGPEPARGEWLVVHSGYAVDRAEAADAGSARAELAAVDGIDGIDGAVEAVEEAGR